MCWQGCGKLGPSYLVGGNEVVQSLWKQLQQLLKILNRVIVLSRYHYRYLSLIWGNSQSLMLQIISSILFSLFSPSSIPITCMLHNYNCPTGLRYSVLSFSLFFSLCISGWKSLLTLLQAYHDFLFDHVQCINELIKNIPHFCYSVFDLQHFLFIPSYFLFLHLYCPSLLACVYFLHQRPQHLIIVVLNSQSDNSNIPGLSESGSEACSVSAKKFFFSVSMFCNFWLKARHDELGKSN